jgi:alpha-amylase
MYFQVHQPHRLSKYSFFDIGTNKGYFSHERNRAIFERVARKCYYPTNALLLKLIERYKGRFKVSFSITGTFIEQCLDYDRGVLDSFKKLVDTGCVDVLDETYYHSLAYLISQKEFRSQIKQHRDLIQEHFDYKPTVFRNTEAMYGNDVARVAESMGYKGILAEGWHSYLGWRSPNYVYRPHGCNEIKLLMRNYKLSDDISFRFSTHTWSEFPLTAPKYVNWLSSNEGQVINLFMDYETFGEHQWQETGIFNFLEHFPGEVFKHRHLGFMTVAEAVKRYEPVGEVDVPVLSSWADMDRDLTAWLGNEMQRDAFHKVKELEPICGQLEGNKLLNDWRKMQTSDHFYYMCTKWFADGDIHKYFNDYDNPYEAFTNYMNILSDLKERLKNNAPVNPQLKAAGPVPADSRPSQPSKHKAPQKAKAEAPNSRISSAKSRSSNRR